MTSVAEVLVGREALERLGSEVRSRSLGLRPRLAWALDDDARGEAARNYLLFAHWPELAGVEATRAFYNRYFWLARLAALNPRDAGLEQQLFQELERAEQAGLVLDWALVEAVDGEAERP